MKGCKMFKGIVTVADIVKAKNSALSIFTEAQAKLKVANDKVEQFKVEAAERIASLNEELNLEQASVVSALAQQSEIEKTFNRIQAILE